MQLRAGRLDELDRLVALSVAFYAEDGFTTPEPRLRENMGILLGSDSARVAVVVAGGALAGFAITTTSFGLENGHIAELEDLYVIPTARRHGLAQRMIEDSAHWARGRGCNQLEVVVAPNAHDVDHLHVYYQRRGFHDDGRKLLSRAL